MSSMYNISVVYPFVGVGKWPPQDPSPSQGTLLESWAYGGVVKLGYVLMLILSTAWGSSLVCSPVMWRTMTCILGFSLSWQEKNNELHFRLEFFDCNFILGHWVQKMLVSKPIWHIGPSIKNSHSLRLPIEPNCARLKYLLMNYEYVRKKLNVRPYLNVSV